MGGAQEAIGRFWRVTAFPGLEAGNVALIILACLLVYLAVRKSFLPALLIPAGFGILLANLPLGVQGGHLLTPAFLAGKAGPVSAMDYLFTGLARGYFPPLLLLGLGALTDFSHLLANPRLIFLGAASQLGLFCAFAFALLSGFGVHEAAGFGIAGGVNAPATFYFASRFSPALLAPLALAACVGAALLPVILPTVMALLTSKEERLIRANPSRNPSQLERVLFPLAAFVVCGLLAPGAALLLGMFFLGNILRESGVTDSLSNTAKSAFLDAVTVLTGLAIGVAVVPATFFRVETAAALVAAVLGVAFAALGGVVFAKIMNAFCADKVNPLVGAAALPAPGAARAAQFAGAKEDPTNYLLGHATAAHAAGLIGSMVAAGVLWALFGI